MDCHNCTVTLSRACGEVSGEPEIGGSLASHHPIPPFLDATAAPLLPGPGSRTAPWSKDPGTDAYILEDSSQPEPSSICSRGYDLAYGLAKDSSSLQSHFLISAPNHRNHQLKISRAKARLGCSSRGDKVGWVQRKTF